MNKFEYKLEFESEFDDILPIINTINALLVQSELNKTIKNIKPTFTILENDSDDI